MAIWGTYPYDLREVSREWGTPIGYPPAVVRGIQRRMLLELENKLVASYDKFVVFCDDPDVVPYRQIWRKLGHLPGSLKNPNTSGRERLEWILCAPASGCGLRHGDHVTLVRPTDGQIIVEWTVDESRAAERWRKMCSSTSS